MRFIQPLLEGILEVMFPKICAGCTGPLARGESGLCGFCRWERFEPADSRLDGSQEILPEYIAFRLALWQFEEGGVLQQLLHQLKYQQRFDLGLEFGRLAGVAVRNLVAASGLAFTYQPLLVPVPMHRKRQRKRGYNQARIMADGMAGVTGWTVIGEKMVVRCRDTLTQTGLSEEKRRENLEGVFRIEAELHPLELPIIVDDVYTTGATALELAAALRRAGAQRIGIATLAEA